MSKLRTPVLSQSTVLRAIVLAMVFVGTLSLLGGSSLPAGMARTRQYSMAVAGSGFDLLGWEASALGEKGRALLTQPAAIIPAHQQANAVREYLERAERIRALEHELDRAYGMAGGSATAEQERSLMQLDEMRPVQASRRPAVEQILQRQVAEVLAANGFGIAGAPFPPVQFTFTDPPKKLIVSPRARIETDYGQMLSPQMSLATIAGAEKAIDDQGDVRAYITNIGGLGAFPTMVVDQGSLQWVLSTVAHEWVHNYLVFFPLGWSYFASPDMTTLNETVAEIVGNEVGAQALRQYYPELVVPWVVASERQDKAVSAENSFDFEREMRQTRLTVDQLLAQGKVDVAERYMEQRRAVFADHGYPLRVLNQAYFAFHGSYGTSGASTSPIGPKLERLRELTPDLHAFLHVVRWFTSPADLDAALAARETAAGGNRGAGAPR